VIDDFTCGGTDIIDDLSKIYNDVRTNDMDGDIVMIDLHVLLLYSFVVNLRTTR